MYMIYNNFFIKKSDYFKLFSFYFIKVLTIVTHMSSVFFAGIVYLPFIPATSFIFKFFKFFSSILLKFSSFIVLRSFLIRYLPSFGFDIRFDLINFIAFPLLRFVSFNFKIQKMQVKEKQRHLCI